MWEEEDGRRGSEAKKEKKAEQTRRRERGGKTDLEDDSPRGPTRAVGAARASAVSWTCRKKTMMLV